MNYIMQLIKNESHDETSRKWVVTQKWIIWFKYLKMNYVKKVCQNYI